MSTANEGQRRQTQYWHVSPCRVSSPDLANTIMFSCAGARSSAHAEAIWSTQAWVSVDVVQT